jgi:hypothetical protein
MVLTWSWLVLSRISGLVKDLRTAASTDYDLDTAEGAPMMVAEAVSRACAPEGLRYPQHDDTLLAVLARDGVPVDLTTMPYGAVVELATGRLGVLTNGGVIESHGTGLSVVPADPARMRRAWLIPGVAYFERSGL